MNLPDGTAPPDGERVPLYASGGSKARIGGGGAS